jgi:hypothetical protein
MDSLFCTTSLGPYSVSSATRSPPFYMPFGVTTLGMRGCGETSTAPCFYTPFGVTAVGTGDFRNVILTASHVSIRPLARPG